MVPNAPHQTLIDGLGVLVLEGHMPQRRALHIIAAYRDYDDDLDEEILMQVHEGLGIAPPEIWRDDCGCPEA
jgi:hypothetical protein